MATFSLKGFVRDVRYAPCFSPETLKVYNITQFKEASLPRSYEAAHRESVTTHLLESLEENTKGVFQISNYLGGQYYLTAD